MESLKDIYDLDPNAQVKHFKKGTVVQNIGDIKAHTFYVKKGLLRSYMIDGKGKEHIFSFAPERWIVGDVESLEFHEPVGLYIDCLEDTEVVRFNRDCLDINEQMSKETIVKTFRLLYRRMGVLQKRVIMQMSSLAVDRYEYFIKTYPELSNRVPQHMIASYLGITPQALSTIRARMAKLK